MCDRRMDGPADGWTYVHTDRQTEWEKNLLDGPTDGIMDEGKRADFVPY